MKRFPVVVASVLLALFLLYSFVLKQDSAGKSVPNNDGISEVVFKSIDGGKTWQDISEGLPVNVVKDGIRWDSVFVNEKSLFVRIGNELYHNAPNPTGDFWSREVVSENKEILSPGKSGIFTSYYWGVKLKKLSGTVVWSPIFDQAHEPRIRIAFEAGEGSIFFGSDEGLFKSTDNGNKWKQVYKGGYVGHVAEFNGILLMTAMRRMFRSTDIGENWILVTSDTSVVFDVKKIDGGFAALTATSVLGARGIKISYDAGKTWQSKNEGNAAVVDSIRRTWNNRTEPRASVVYVCEIGGALFSSDRDGIHTSTDKGKTWKLVLSPATNKTFIILNSGNLIYAVTSKGGC